MKENYDFSKAKRGPVAAAAGKTRITIYIDNDVLEAFRLRAGADGMGYQTLINSVLRQSVSGKSKPVTEDVLRRVIREELKAA